MAYVHKAHKKKTEVTKTQPIVVSDLVTETTERIEVIEETSEPKSETKKAEKSAPATDPLTDFKEKMNEEESLPSDVPAKKNFMWPILFIFIIALLMLGGIFIYKNNTKIQKINVVTLSPTPTLSPVPTKTVDLSKYAIKILNGSGIDGEAGRQKTNLQAEGFTVSTVGNANQSNYTKTIIQTKEDVDKDFLDKLKSVLEKSFTLADTERLSETVTIPVVIIIGNKK